ncbi:MFS transporter [Alphaproteobacteria bacterium]|nr:MFS transporter [Alphaproteobacteria bacterium]
MPRRLVFSLFFLAIFLQSGAYGLTFMLPKLFAGFGANEKDVGTMLLITTVSTLLAVYYAGHLSDRFGRLATLGWACFSIAVALFLFGYSQVLDWQIMLASVLLGAGWGLTYSLGPVVLTRITEASERVGNFALLSVFVMAGFGLSPVLASVMEKQGLTTADTFYVVALLCVVSGLIFFALIKPIQSQVLDKEPEARSRLSLSAVTAIFRSKAVLPVTMVFLGASVFAGMSNFQTVFADARGLDYSWFFLIYTITVIVCRVILVRYKGGNTPYLTIAALQYVMAASVILFIVMGSNAGLYVLVAILFGIGYGASYPILVAMAANDANKDIVPQTLQFFALTYFIGIFGFPKIAGWLLVESSMLALLVLVSAMAFIEATMALVRALGEKKSAKTN